MKRFVCISLLILITSTSAHPKDFGIGVSMKNDGGSIYFPINISKKFRVEPQIRRFDFKSHRTQTSLSSFTPGTSRTTDEFETTELGLGFFGLHGLMESTRLYYGLRISYVKKKSLFKREVNFDSPLIPSSSIASKNNSKGYRISPTLGLEYFFGNRFSLAGEVEWFYLDTDGDIKQSSNSLAFPKGREDTQENGTNTRALLRYYFK